MSAPSDKSASHNPADIAREAFRRLAARRVAPTPDAYRAIYNEIAGQAARPDAESILTDFATRLGGVSGELGETGQACARAARDHDWQACGAQLHRLLDRHLAQRPAAAPVPGTPTPPPSVLITGAQGNLLRDMLVRALGLALTSQLQHTPELAAEAEALAAAVKQAEGTDDLNRATSRLQQLCFRIEQDGEDMQNQQEMLLKLFRLLLDNVKEFVAEDSWLAGQIVSLRTLIDQPVHPAMLQEAARTLKDIIYKQGTLQHSLGDARATVKNMMLSFIECLSTTAASTRDYHQKIERYVAEISRTDDLQALNGILHEVMRDMLLQGEALRSRDQMQQAEQEAQQADGRIKTLESQLAHMSELVREDQLTGSLNRRGLEDVLERELARTDRRGTPLCIALLDLDDFKRINDTHGHAAGDEALIHLVRVVKDTLRTMDVIARFGGEEFLILLPDTPLDSASATITRLQRELTKRIFLYNNQRLLITFSAGVALRAPNETRSALIGRADAALYRAKKAGKNRVVSAG